MIIGDRANAKWRLEHGTDATIRNHAFNTANWAMSLRNNAQEICKVSLVTLTFSDINKFDLFLNKNSSFLQFLRYEISEIAYQ